MIDITHKSPANNGFLKVALDLDGVLVNFCGGFVNIVNTIWPSRLLLNYSPTSWNWGGSNLTEAEIDRVWVNIHRRGDIFWQTLLPLSQSTMMAVKQLSWDCDLYFVSHRPDYTKKATLKWLYKYLKNQELQVLLVNSSVNKAPLYNALGIQYSLDDNVQVVTQCDALPNHTAYLLQQPWNKRASQEFPIKHMVESVEEFIAKIPQKVED